MTTPYLAAPSLRTRIAPSPRGFIHIGWYRNIIFSWLLAQRYGGQLLLRIEDTDIQRVIPGAVENLMEGLAWLGIDPDEGPYYQSQRCNIYIKYAYQMLSSGHAYRCFCTKERQETMQETQRLPSPGYNRLCRWLTPNEIEARLVAGESFVIRFKVPTMGVTCVMDVVRGKVVFNNNTLEDSILLRSNGYPTYHLASVVDDHLMKISHVLLNDASLSSAPLHKMIYEALGWEWPLTAHIPQVLAHDGKPLSKRRGAQSLLAYRDQGYLPEAIINYLALLGWSFDGKAEIISVPELQTSFSLNRISRSNAFFSEQRMKWMNGVYIRKLDIDDLLARSLPFLECPERDGGLPDHIARPLDHVYIKRVLHLNQERIKLLNEVPYLSLFFFDNQLQYPIDWLIMEGLSITQTYQALITILHAIESLTRWEAHLLEDKLRQVASSLGIKSRPLFMSVRVAVTGRKETPPLFETMEVLGPRRTLDRLRAGIAGLASRYSQLAEEEDALRHEKSD